jgi:hypothetical protein
LNSPQKEPASPDVLVNNVGMLYTFCPLTLRAKEWIDEHVQGDAQWFGHALVVEHRYAWGLREYGANILGKPFLPSELLRKVDDILDQGQGATGTG